MSSNPPLRLDSGHNIAWKIHAAPVAILNAESTLHDRLAYLWAQADQVLELALVLGGHEKEDVSRAGAILERHLQPMANLLAHMAEETSAEDQKEVQL